MEDFNINLVRNTILKNDWDIIDFSEGGASWGYDSETNIIQTKSIGTKKQATGTAALFKRFYDNNIDTIEANINNGGVNQSGIVFNFTDQSNYHLFIIDQKSTNYVGYEVIIAIIQNNDFDIICSEKYENEIEGDDIFKIKQLTNGLSFEYQNNEVFFWPEKTFLQRTRIGLYNQKNQNAKYSNLFIKANNVNTVNNNTSIPETTETENNNDAGLPQENDKQDSPINPENRKVDADVTRFLGLQEPASKTTVEFNEVFTVPLDEYYQSIINTHDLENSNGNSASGATIVEYLDIRTKRWYRLYHDYSNKINYTKLDYENAQARLIIAEKKIQDSLQPNNQETLSEDDFNKLEKDLEMQRANIISKRNLIYKYNDKMTELLREIRTNGYNVKDNTEIQKIIEAGYDFQIDKSVNESKYKPIKLEPQMWLGEDENGNENWQETLTKMSELLLEGDLLSPANRELFKTQVQQLEKLANNDILKEKIHKIKSQISIINQEIIKATYKQDVRTKEKKLWKDDLNDLKQAKNYFESKYGGDEKNVKTMTDNESIYNYLIELVNWWKGTADNNLYKTTTLSEDPGIQYNREDYGAYFKFRSNYYHGYMRLYDIPQLINQFPDIDVTIEYYGLRVFSYKIAGPYEHQYTGKTFIMASAGNLPTADRPFRSGMSYIGDIYNGTENLGLVRRLHAFFDNAIKICNFRLDESLPNLLSHSESTILAGYNSISAHNREITAIEKHGLHELRWAFINKWNDPEKNGTGSINRKPILPASDPLAEFLIETANDANEINNEVVFFQPSSSGFYNQFGQSLESFMENNDKTDAVVVLPYFDSQGGISNEVIQVVRNPIPSKEAPRHPAIKLVENYAVTVGWQGYGLGELSHSFNLLPGETKEMVVEKSTKKTTKVSEKVGREEARKQSQTSSFEDNLKEELSSDQKSSKTTEDKAKIATTDKSVDKSGAGGEDTTSEEDSFSETKNWEIAAKAEADWGWGSLEVSGSAGGKTDSKRSRQSSAKSTWNRSNEDAFETSKTTEGQKKNNQSTEVMQKNLANSIKKVANETSLNNKVEFSSTSSEEYQEEATNKEVIKLENPNIGKTVNYNFFQVQNIYGTTGRMTDVKIVVDTGIELIDQTGINDVKVYEIEEFGKIFCNSDGTDRSAILAAIIAKKVLDHYAQIEPYFTSGNGAIQVRTGFKIDNEKLKVIKFLGGVACKAGCDEETVVTSEEKYSLIKSALHYLKKVPFEFKDSVLDVMKDEPQICVNAGAYHVEAQVGLMPATEEYLEDRRDIETERQRALTEELRARTKAGVFHQKLPESLTNLTLDKEK